MISCFNIMCKRASRYVYLVDDELAGHVGHDQPVVPIPHQVHQANIALQIDKHIYNNRLRHGLGSASSVYHIDEGGLPVEGREASHRVMPCV